MTTWQSTAIVIIVIVALGVLVLAFQGRNTSPDNKVAVPEPSESIRGCYIATTGNDVYTLNIQTVEGENVAGTLEFDNFQRDSSSGIFEGTYRDGLLVGDYSFHSEGMFSVVQVVFLRSGEDFIRGYGDLNEEGTRFADLADIVFDSSSTLHFFKKGECPL